MSAAAIGVEPPNNPQAERAALAAAMLSPRALVELFETLGSDPAAAFFEQSHATICRAMFALAQAGRAVDLVTLADRLTAMGEIDRIGGVVGLADLAGASPTSANVGHYAGVVRDCWIRRRLQDLARDLHQRAADTSTELTAVLETAEQAVFGLAHRRTQAAATSIRQHLGEAYRRLEQAGRNTGEIDGLSYGLADLDRLTCGLKVGEVSVVAARPSVGKTAFALNVAAHVATVQHCGVLIYSLEMTAAQLTSRLLCLTGGVDIERIRSGYLGKDALSRAQRAAGFLNESGIWIDESVSLTPIELRARSRRHASRYPALGLIIIDYLQLMHTSGKSENRQNEVAEISRAIKCVAREVNVPVLCLSQLSREAEKSEGYGPQLAHLRDSGAIEQDADVVLMLQRPRGKVGQAPSSDLLCRVAKNRNGLTGDVALCFRRETQQILPGGASDAPAGCRPGDDEEDYLD